MDNKISDKIIIYCIYLLIFISIYFFRSFYFDIKGLLIVFGIAALPTLSFTKSDLDAWNYYHSRTPKRIKLEKKLFGKLDSRKEEGFNEKNKYFFLLKRFVYNLLLWSIIICGLLSMLLVFIKIYMLF